MTIIYSKTFFFSFDFIFLLICWHLFIMTNLWFFQEEKLKDKPGYEHLNEPLHVLVEAEFPEDIINARLDHAVAILENLLKPVVCTNIEHVV